MNQIERKISLFLFETLLDANSNEQDADTVCKINTYIDSWEQGNACRYRLLLARIIMVNDEKLINYFTEQDKLKQYLHNDNLRKVVFDVALISGNMSLIRKLEKTLFKSSDILRRFYLRCSSRYPAQNVPPGKNSRHGLTLAAQGGIYPINFKMHVLCYPFCRPQNV